MPRSTICSPALTHHVPRLNASHAGVVSTLHHAAFVLLPCVGHTSHRRSGKRSSISACSASSVQTVSLHRFVDCASSNVSLQQCWQPAACPTEATRPPLVPTCSRRYTSALPSCVRCRPSHRRPCCQPGTSYGQAEGGGWACMPVSLACKAQASPSCHQHTCTCCPATDASNLSLHSASPLPLSLPHQAHLECAPQVEAGHPQLCCQRLGGRGVLASHLVGALRHSQPHAVRLF